jgi:hypothetical protein
VSADFAGRVDSALAELDHAQRYDDAGSAINALIYVGMAEVALGRDSLVSAPRAAVQRDALRSSAEAHGDLIARAAANLDVRIRQRPDDDGLVDALLARTGYQVLLDLGTWPEPPLDDFHLGEVDEELAEAVAAAPPDVPEGVPPSHRWWWPTPSAGDGGSSAAD